MNEFIIDFQITSKCNLNCSFCCGADKTKKDVDTITIKKVIDKLKDVGVDRIVLTGGEPLLRKDIDEIIEYIYDKNINVYLSTNGYYINEHIDTVSKYVDCVGLPLDGYTEEISEKMTRKKEQLVTTFNAIKSIREKNDKIIIKVGTVVSKINYKTLKELGELLYKEKEISPDVWRLYQFTPLGEGYKNSEVFEISDEEYLRTVSEIKNLFYNRNIGSLSNEESNDTYIFVSPDMELIGLTEDNYISLGNVLNMSLDELKILKEDMKETLQNAKKNRKWTNSK